MVGQVSCSVIIPTYNRSKLLRYTLDCLRKQRRSEKDFEIIIVDDGSTDDSLEAVRNFESDIRIRYIWKPDEGFRAAEARNCGVKLAQGDVIIFIDSGVLVGSDFVQSHLSMHRQSLSPLAVIGYVYGFGDLDRSSKKLADLVKPSIIDDFIEQNSKSRNYLDSREFIYERTEDKLDVLSTPWCLFWTCNVSVLRKTVEGVGLFDEEFKSWGAEDIELGYRLYLAGVKYALAREAAAVHFPHDEKQRSQLDAFRNYRYFSRKHGVPMSAITGTELIG